MTINVLSLPRPLHLRVDEPLHNYEHSERVTYHSATAHSSGNFIALASFTKFRWGLCPFYDLLVLNTRMMLYDIPLRLMIFDTTYYSISEERQAEITGQILSHVLFSFVFCSLLVGFFREHGLLVRGWAGMYSITAIMLL